MLLYVFATTFAFCAKYRRAVKFGYKRGFNYVDKARSPIRNDFPFPCADKTNFHECIDRCIFRLPSSLKMIQPLKWRRTKLWVFPPFFTLKDNSWLAKKRISLHLMLKKVAKSASFHDSATAAAFGGGFSPFLTLCFSPSFYTELPSLRENLFATNL